jgi:predicted peptidase
MAKTVCLPRGVGNGKTIGLNQLFIPMNPKQESWRELYEKREFAAASGERLLYRLLPPAELEKGRRYPLLLFLHGAGERGQDNERQLYHGGQCLAEASFRRDYPAWVMAPQCPEQRYWVEMDWRRGEDRQRAQPAAPLQQCLAAIEALQEEVAIDRRRMYVMGLSMGGFGTWDLVSRFPGRFAAAVPICGGGDPRRAPELRDTPLWVFHGADDPVVPVEYSRRMVEAIRGAGGTPRYTEYERTGPNSWDPAFREPELFAWLFSHGGAGLRGR